MQIDSWAVGQMADGHIHTCTHAQLHTVVFLTMLPQTDMNGSHVPHIHRLQQSCSPSLSELTLQEQQAIQHAGHSCSLLCPWLLLTKLAHFIHPSCLMSADELRVYAAKATLHTRLCMQMLMPQNLNLCTSAIHPSHPHAAASASPFAGVGMATGPPGELGSLAVRISTPSSVTSRVCSITWLALNQSTPREYIPNWAVREPS
jgi:hypothetical protein